MYLVGMADAPQSVAQVVSRCRQQRAGQDCHGCGGSDTDLALPQKKTVYMWC